MIIGLKYQPGSTDVRSLNAQTSGTGAEVVLNECRQIAPTITGVGTVTGGVVVLESSNVSGYAGTWAEQDRIDFSVTPLTDSKYQISLPGGYGPFYRHRIVSSITGGGNVSSEINGIEG